MTERKGWDKEKKGKERKNKEKRIGKDSGCKTEREGTDGHSQWSCLH